MEVGFQLHTPVSLSHRKQHQLYIAIRLSIPHNRPEGGAEQKLLFSLSGIEIPFLSRATSNFVANPCYLMKQENGHDLYVRTMNVRSWTEGTLSAVALKRSRKHFNVERSQHNLRHYRNNDIVNRNCILTPRTYSPYLQQQGYFSFSLRASVSSRHLREKSFNPREEVILLP